MTDSHCRAEAGGVVLAYAAIMSDHPETHAPQPSVPHVARRAIRLLPAVVVGVVTGLFVTGLRYLTTDVMWAALQRQDAWVLFVVPAAGITLSGVLLRWFAKRPEVHDAEAYVESYHQRSSERDWRSFLAKTAASVTTVGMGGAAGLEGPSLYVGSSLGGWVARRLEGVGIEHEGWRPMLVAGAAAGISAVFKAPLTGLIFALEMPYTDDFAREALIPSMLASVSSYLVAITILGTEPIFKLNRAYVPSVSSVFLALALGVCVGIAARLFLHSLRTAGDWGTRFRIPLVARTAIGGVLCGAFGVASLWIFRSPLALASGYELIDVAMAGRVVGFAAVLLLLLRGGAVVATLGSGASGGSFVPLVSMGAITGSIFEAIAPATGPLFPMVGMAAFLAAANATPIAGAVFVAESTGSAGFVIPGLVAAAAAYVVAGGGTLSAHQRPSRRGMDAR